MPLPRIQRGELWLVALGYPGKVRPVLVVSVPFLAHERTLCIVVPHTASLIGTRFDSRSVAIACAPRASDHQSNGTL